MTHCVERTRKPFANNLRISLLLWWLSMHIFLSPWRWWLALWAPNDEHQEANSMLPCISNNESWEKCLFQQYMADMAIKLELIGCAASKWIKQCWTQLYKEVWLVHWMMIILETLEGASFFLQHLLMDQDIWWNNVRIPWRLCHAIQTGQKYDIICFYSSHFSLKPNFVGDKGARLEVGKPKFCSPSATKAHWVNLGYTLSLY